MDTQSLLDQVLSHLNRTVKNAPDANAPGHFLLVLFFLAEDRPEYQSYKRSAVKHLIQDRHWEVHRPGLHPCTECFGVLEKDRSDKTHGRTHDTADADRNGVCDELRSVVRAHNGKR